MFTLNEDFLSSDPIIREKAKRDSNKLWFAKLTKQQQKVLKQVKSLLASVGLDYMAVEWMEEIEE